MKKKILVPFTITEKMLKHFKALPFEKNGELALPTQRDNSENRYLNNFVELGLLYEVVLDDNWGSKTETTFYLTHFGKSILNHY